MDTTGYSTVETLCSSKSIEFIISIHNLRWLTVRLVLVQTWAFGRMGQPAGVGSGHQKILMSINLNVTEPSYLVAPVDFPCPIRTFSLFSDIVSFIVPLGFRASKKEAQSNCKQLPHGHTTFQGSNAGIDLRLNMVLKIRASIFLSTSTSSPFPLPRR